MVKFNDTSDAFRARRVPGSSGPVPARTGGMPEGLEEMQQSAVHRTALDLFRADGPALEGNLNINQNTLEQLQTFILQIFEKFTGRLEERYTPEPGGEPVEVLRGLHESKMLDGMDPEFVRTVEEISVDTARIGGDYGENLRQGLEGRWLAPLLDKVGAAAEKNEPMAKAQRWVTADEAKLTSTESRMTPDSEFGVRHYDGRENFVSTGAPREIDPAKFKSAKDFTPPEKIREQKLSQEFKISASGEPRELSQALFIKEGPDRANIIRQGGSAQSMKNLIAEKLEGPHENVLGLIERQIDRGHFDRVDRALVDAGRDPNALEHMVKNGMKPTPGDALAKKYIGALQEYREGGSSGQLHSRLDEIRNEFKQDMFAQIDANAPAEPSPGLAGLGAPGR